MTALLFVCYRLSKFAASERPVSIFMQPDLEQPVVALDYRKMVLPRRSNPLIVLGAVIGSFAIKYLSALGNT
ncbi:MAG TPA: hypothetical protein VGO54_15220 [Bradyrhizobium sp.]|jgi:hypothetical protein|nr:hypothetical protein [Bradyrhizobium sp.]